MRTASRSTRAIEYAPFFARAWLTKNALFSFRLRTILSARSLRVMSVIA
jgi:hypothetical protein